MKISGFAPYCKRVHLKKCLIKPPALKLVFRSNRPSSAAVRYNLIFTIFTPISIVAIRRNIVKIDDYLNSDKMQLHSYLWPNLKHESKWRLWAGKKRRGSFFADNTNLLPLLPLASCSLLGNMRDALKGTTLIYCIRVIRPTHHPGFHLNRRMNR